jgi:hypothetical protein
LGFGIDNKEVPEEWENHNASGRLPLALDTYATPLIPQCGSIADNEFRSVNCSEATWKYLTKSWWPNMQKEGKLTIE